MYWVFKRKAWVRDPTYPGGWKPFVGRKTHVAYVDTPDEARRICGEHNRNRKSRGEPFCEFTAAY